MLTDTLLLITLRWQLAWNSFRGRSLIRRILIIAFFGWVGAAMMGGSAMAGLGAGSLLRFFPALQLESLIPGLILTAIALMLFVNSFGVALGSLFLSSDLERLMTAPVDRRAVFISKILDGTASYYALTLALATPALVMYGIGLRYGPAYYVLTLIALLGTPLLPAGLGSLAVMLVARFAPARRVREFMGLVAAVFGIGCSVISNLNRWWARPGTVSRLDLSAFLEQARQFADLPIPSFVAGKGLAAAGVGNIGLALIDLSGFLLLTFGLFAVCIWFADKLYSTGWMRMQSSGVANRSKERSARFAARTGLLGDATPALAIALKDWRVIPRDLRNFAQFITPLILLPILYLNFFGGRREGFNALNEANTFGQGLVDFTNAFVAAGILMSGVFVFSRIASTGISMEGKSWWLMKAAPISGRELLLGKFTAAMVPFAIVTTLMFIGVAAWRGFSLPGAIYGWLGIMSLGAGMLAIDVGMAVPWANLTWDDPRRMSSGWGGLFAMIGTTVMGLAAGLCLSLPLIARVLLPDLEIAAWIVGPLLAIGITLGIATLMVGIGLKFLPNVGEA